MRLGHSLVVIVAVLWAVPTIAVSQQFTPGKSYLAPGRAPEIQPMLWTRTPPG